jgi:formylglycine-generating enzyme required for sulfatase activity
VTGRDAARHQRVTELFLAASELPDGRRAAFLETACAGDAELAREVRSLLEADGAADDFLTRSAQEATHANHGVSWLGAADELTRVGPYELLGVLGEGGMGVVYEAEQEHPRRRVALKVLRTGLTSKSALRRFEYEAEVLGRLRHPGIAQVFDAGTAETPRGARPYFAMEVVRGEPLLRWAARKRLGLRERLRLFNHICEAVQHAHLKGVVHRDLKPSNILVDDEGQPRVLDFGIARAVEPGLDTDSWRTGEGQLLGTLPYMSPEQASGDPDGVDTRSDVYSLGVVLFELLTGELPLDLAGQNFAAAVATITGGTPRRLSQFERAYKGDLDTIAAKALDRDRRRRYASAAELALDITRYLRHEPIVARPASTTYHLRKFVARNKALVAVALTALAAIVVAFVLIGVALRRARQAERDSEENLREVERFSDQLVITDLTAEAENLFPRVPALKRQFQLWLERAREVQARREQHTALMQRLRAQTLAEQVAAGKLPADATEPFWPPEDVRVSWRYYMAEVTLAELDELALLMANVEERLRFADDIPRLTFETHARDWERARLAIADSPHYGGLVLPAQLGLVPLEPDPRTGFWEFWDMHTGTRPERDQETGRWIVTGDTGLVFVLLPGDTFDMGANLPTAERALGLPNVDPSAGDLESPVNSVTLDPFFISKYELTQGQWLRFRGSNPSFIRPGLEFPLPDTITLAHPVESISWTEADRMMWQMGLELPTEAQWEYAARGGTTSIWWTGDDPLTLSGEENLADGRSRLHGATPNWRPIDGVEDDWNSHAPVGSLTPNGFGLHDVVGNVMEWTRDRRSEYETPAQAGNGLRHPAPGSMSYMRRGGSYRSGLLLTRSAARGPWPPNNRSNQVGVRPSRSIQR